MCKVAEDTFLYLSYCCVLLPALCLNFAHDQNHLPANRLWSIIKKIFVSHIINSIYYLDDNENWICVYIHLKLFYYSTFFAAHFSPTVKQCHKGRKDSGRLTWSTLDTLSLDLYSVARPETGERQ